MDTTQQETVPQLRLPGQTAAPEGPVDMSMMYLMHHAFRRDLAAFAAAAPLTPVEDRETWRALADRWELFSTALHHHHHGEDTWLWPFLMERADASERAVLQAMEDEHAQIDPTLEGCAAGFARLRDHADDDVRAALAVRLAAARESLSRHLRHEETEAIALLQRVMTNQEWHAIDENFKRGVAFSSLVQLVPWVIHRVPADVRELVFAETGLLHRTLWWLTRRRFERRDADAFRYAEA
jgi:iron-sulfur cluster repair protein YtfE (RIC family)